MEQLAVTIAAGIIALSSLVFTPQAFFRQNVLGESDNTTNNTQQQEQENEQEDVDENKEENRGKRQEEEQERRKQMKQEAAAKRDAIKREAQERREEMKNEMEKKRTEFKENLAKIKDERKRTVAAKVCEKFETTATNISSHLSDRLAHIAELVGKLETRVAKAAQNGHDVALCQERVTTAKAAIDAAQNAVNTQSEKTYSCEIADEASLGQTIGAVKRQMQQDAKNTRTTVEQTHAAIKQALTCLRSIKGVDDDTTEQ